MKMLIIVAGDFIEDALADTLMDSGITKYTMVSKSHGVGEAGGKDNTIMIFAAVTEQQADCAVDRFKNLRTRRLEALKGNIFPLRIFAMPCEQLL